MGWGRGGGRGRVWGGQGGCDRRIEKFFGKFTKKIQGGGGVGLGGVRVDVNEELKFLCKFKKKKFFFFFGGGGFRRGGGGGVGFGESVWM